MFPTGDLTRMQTAQQTHMPDTCRRMSYSRTQSESGADVETWTEIAVDIPCGIDQTSKRSDAEKVESNMTVVVYDAVVRLPLAQAEQWNIKDRLLLTHRFGTAITPITYGVAAPVVRGPSGIRLNLQKVEV